MTQPATTDKQRMLEILECQPDESSNDELLRELAFERMIEPGSAEAQTSRTIAQEKMGRRIAAWEN